MVTRVFCTQANFNFIDNFLRNPLSMRKPISLANKINKGKLTWGYYWIFRKGNAGFGGADEGHIVIKYRLKGI